MMVSVGQLDQAQEREYRDLVLADPRRLIYPTLEFRDFLRSVVPGEPHCLVARRQGRMVGALPYFALAREDLGTVVNSLPWFGSHGSCVLADCADAQARHALLDRYAEIARAPGTLSATLILCPQEQEHVGHYIEHVSTVATDRRMGQITPLPHDGADLGARLERTVTQKTRNLVRKAFKQGFSLDTSDAEANWLFLHDTHSENMAALGGKAKPWRHFVALRKALPQSWRSVSVALLEGRPVAALLLLFFNHTVEYFIPAVRHEYRSLQPLSFLIWEGMVEAVRRGLKWWNWGGTWPSQHSLHHFKAGWGAVDLPYTYLISAPAAGIATLRAQRGRLAEAFPYYYVFPYTLLEGPDAD